MRPSFSFCLFPLLFLFLCPSRAIPARKLIHETCQKCAQNDPNLTYNFCVTSLQAAPKSPCAETLRELGMISIKLLRRNVTSTKSHIEELLQQNQSDPFIKGCLNDCLELYSDAIPSLQLAIADYKAKHYVDANIDVSSVMDAASTCEDGFKEKKGAASPLRKRNKDTFQLSALSLTIVNMLA